MRKGTFVAGSLSASPDLPGLWCCFFCAFRHCQGFRVLGFSGLGFWGFRVFVFFRWGQVFGFQGFQGPQGFWVLGLEGFSVLALVLQGFRPLEFFGPQDSRTLGFQGFRPSRFFCALELQGLRVWAFLSFSVWGFYAVQGFQGFASILRFSGLRFCFGFSGFRVLGLGLQGFGFLAFSGFRACGLSGFGALGFWRFMALGLSGLPVGL